MNLLQKRNVGFTLLGIILFLILILFLIQPTTLSGQLLFHIPILILAGISAYLLIESYTNTSSHSRYKYMLETGLEEYGKSSRDRPLSIETTDPFSEFSPVLRSQLRAEGADQPSSSTTSQKIKARRRQGRYFGSP